MTTRQYPGGIYDNTVIYSLEKAKSNRIFVFSNKKAGAEIR